MAFSVVVIFERRLIFRQVRQEVFFPRIIPTRIAARVIFPIVFALSPTHRMEL